MNSSNIRKAAILVRSLDAETASRLLDQLSPAEVDAVRQAIRALGELDDEEQADVAAELRRAASTVIEDRGSGVEIAFSMDNPPESPLPGDLKVPSQGENSRFAFLDKAAPSDLAHVLMREHPQTAAVVLSLLDARRAADVLVALPEECQMHVLDRLADLGDADPDCLEVIEHELLAWATRQPQRPSTARCHGDHATRILMAADPTTRRSLASKLRGDHARTANSLLASVAKDDEAAPARKVSRPVPENEWGEGRERSSSRPPGPSRGPSALGPTVPSRPPVDSTALPPRPAIPFERLVDMDSRTIVAIFREVDANVLQLALAGADEALVDRVASQLPKRAAKQFRARLHQLGPTRISDVLAAQQIVAQVATRVLAEKRIPLTVRA